MRNIFGKLALILLPFALVACSDKPITMNGNLSGRLETRLDGQVATTVKIEGPMQIQLQMQGPTVRYEGTYISDELLERIEEGRTTDDWVIAVFGEPTARATLRNGTEIWRWIYRPTVQESAIFEVFSKSEKEPKLATHSVFVQIADGIVAKKWKG